MSKSDGARTVGESRTVSPRIIIAGVVAVVALLFVFQNAATATVNFLWIDINAPGWIWLLGLFLAGAVVGSIMPWFRRKQKPTS